MSVSKRTGEFSKNEHLEILLKDINSILWTSEKILLKETAFDHPLILILGPMRSGSTLFMQWLGKNGVAKFPTNLLSRFYNAPIIGAKIELLLTDPRYNFREELFEFTQEVSFKSSNGKTKGVLEPNEFWYFWRRFLPDSSKDIWSNEELNMELDRETLLSEISGIIKVFNMPFVTKAMLFNYNVPFLDFLFDKVLFIHLIRDENTNAESVLEARNKQFGNEHYWYSFDIPEKEELLKLPPKEQVLGQIRAINNAVEKGLSQVRDERKLTIHYEDFCKNPKKYFKLITQKLNYYPGLYKGPNKFEKTR